MKRKIIYSFAATLLVLVLFSSGCTKDFKEINTNPNAPGINQAAPNMLLTNAIESMTDRVHEIFLGHEMGSCWVQHMAKVQYPDEDRYIPRMAVINTSWSSFYAASGYDIQTIYNIAVASNNDSYKAVALILKSYVTSVLTDEFGDVPYTEAWKGNDATPILSPVYDTQESIYTALLANLVEANTLLTEDAAAIEGDILYGNDLMLWKKFANSLRLRLLMRRSDRVDPTADITAIVNDPVTYPIFESNDDNAALQYLGSAPSNHPINENRKQRDDHRVSKTLIDIMWTNNPNMDYRIAVYANLPGAGGWWNGLPNGMTSTDAANYEGNGLTKTSKIGNYFSAAQSPGVLMTYAETQFILAEAVNRGFLTGALTDSAYYVSGITASYYQYADAIVASNKAIAALGIPDEWTIDDMLADYLAKYAAWDLSKPLEQIRTEKWLALFGQGLEAKFEWNRTNTPVLVPAISGQNDGKIPVRAYYPSDEYGRNQTNVNAAVTRQGADDLNTRVWWDTENNY
ncbi:MAG: SusD/RagB family nutrient-binding outer membrane lipoprotein [Bacteroidales bacterium]|nr:SusD/RagB family nutrient-binding outer membrane lipoprotein [Bacteroidales bacterium]